jgi:hypothetical protein
VDAAGRALEEALTAHFMAERLNRLSAAYVLGSTAPSLLLWVNAWHALPELVTWLGVLGWAACVTLAVTLAVASERWRARLDETLPEAQRVVHVQFASAEPTIALSAIWLTLAAALSSLLWVQGLRPGLVPVPVIAIVVRAWLVLLAAALASRWQEGWA